MNNIENGCLGLWYKDTDFILCDWLETLPKLVKQNKVRFFYNQWKQSWSKKSCTIFWAGKALADLFDEPLWLSEFREVDEESYNRTRKPDSWWYVWLAVDLWREWWNSNKALVSKYGKVASYYIDMKNDKDVASIISYDYDIVTGFNGNAKYTLDTADWTLDWTDFWPSTYWHCINIVEDNSKPKVQDNYWENSWYYLKHMPSQIKWWHNWWYLFTKVKENNYEELKKQEAMKTKVVLAIQTNSELRHLTSDEKYRKVLNEMNNVNRKKLQTIEDIIKHLN